jgi:hypothetical protein
MDLDLNLLAARARKLGCWIDQYGPEEMDPEVDKGPYLLKYAGLKDLVWETGLPLEGITDALDCYERELQLPEGADIGKAWANFGLGWAAD